ncbi:MAG: nicotinate-nucleotide diphosphorylase (carboxylating), partial [Mesorhizobium sp.]
VAGLDLVSYAFLLVEPAINIQIWRPDGSDVGAGETIARLSGPARGLLTAERTALNFLCRLSGIATATAAMVEAVRGHKARIVST